MSEKRPETDADILSRSRPVSGAELRKSTRRKSRYSVDLPSHMAECDANYHRLLSLFPALRESECRQIALPLEHLNAKVVFEVLERGPYTTLLKIDLEADAQWLEMASSPAMTVRVYHDAKSAEVVSYQRQNRFHGAYEYPNTRMRQRDEKAQINRFLGEFLTLCLEHGASTQTISLQ